MKTNNIETNLNDLFSRSFVVPLYQRNFAWGELQIRQLLQDIFEAFTHGVDNYFVGTLVMIRRKDGLLEVIDGQQRLTVVSLMAKMLRPSIKRCPLTYDSREETNRFLINYYEADGSDEDMDFIAPQSFKSAIKFIGISQLDPENDESLTLEKWQEQQNDRFFDFVDYFFEHVIFVCAEMPRDTDVAEYFEIMNNTGEQLQKHEILKSLLMNKLNKEDVNQMLIFAKVWDACSQMNVRIERCFSTHNKECLFGLGFDQINLDSLGDLRFNGDEIESESQIEDSVNEESLYDILSNPKYDKDYTEQITKTEDFSDEKGGAIIDFPNFLMHVFRLLYGKEYSRRKEDNTEIPLNESELLNVFHELEQMGLINDAVYFIQCLLYYRIIFDRYIVRSQDNSQEDRWELKRPCRRSDKSLDYQPSFEKSDRIIKPLSMLQVSFPQRKYKNYLCEVLSWFEVGRVSMSGSEYLRNLNRFILETFNERYLNNHEKYKTKDELFCLGTSTPRFLLNFIDYLYYLKGQYKFDFKYYNSVEHHLPQSRETYQNYDRSIIDNIGNLYLLSKRINSSKNDNDPLTKIVKTNDDGSLAPNRSIIYKITKSQKGWGKKEILQHRKELEDLIEERYGLLGFASLDCTDNTVKRALLCLKDVFLEETRAKYREDIKGEPLFGMRYGWAFDKEDAMDNFFKPEYESILKWSQEHLDLSLQDFVDLQLCSPDSEINRPENEWRKMFVKYPSVLEYTREGKVVFAREGTYIKLFSGQRYSYCNCHELRAHILVEELNRTKGIVASLWYNDFVYIPLDDSLRPANDEVDTNISLRAWLDYGRRNDDGRWHYDWCYDVEFQNHNTRWYPINNLICNGWHTVNDKKHLYKEGRQFLVVDNGYTIEESLAEAKEEIVKLLTEMAKYT